MGVDTHFFVDIVDICIRHSLHHVASVHFDVDDVFAAKQVDHI